MSSSRVFVCLFHVIICIRLSRITHGKRNTTNKIFGVHTYEDGRIQKKKKNVCKNLVLHLLIGGDIFDKWFLFVTPCCLFFRLIHVFTIITTIDLGVVWIVLCVCVCVCVLLLPDVVMWLWLMLTPCM